jgi:hypothetical protein
MLNRNDRGTVAWRADRDVRRSHSIAIAGYIGAPR